MDGLIARLRRMHKEILCIWGATDEDLIARCFQRIVDEYGQPGRFYHVLTHAGDNVRLVEMYAYLFDNPDASIIAQIYHDIVYLPGAKDNERRSAEWMARDLAACRIPQKFVSKPWSCIMATTHTGDATGNDECRNADIDLAGLAAPWKKFAMNNELIGNEYLRVFPKEEYLLDRRKFLTNMLNRPRIYYTNTFYHRYEDTARANLTRALKELGETT